MNSRDIQDLGKKKIADLLHFEDNSESVQRMVKK